MFNDPASAGMPYLNQIPGQLYPYFNPYIQGGQGAYGQLQGQYGQLMGQLPGLQGQYGALSGMGQGVMANAQNAMMNPAGVMNQIGSQYQQSPGYQFQYGQAMNAANGAAAAGGMVGTPQHQQQAAQMAQGLASQDYGRYMQNALGVYGQGSQQAQNMYGMGLQGQQGLYNAGLMGTQGLNQMGFNASGEYGNDLAQALSQQANMAYQGQQSQNQTDASMFGELFGGLGSMFGTQGGQGMLKGMGQFGASLAPFFMAA